MAIIVGRRKEQEDLLEWCRSRKAELICLCGRRGVGKTFLVEKTFRDRLAFSATGSAGGLMRAQLRGFHEALRKYGSCERAMPRDWFEAFWRLRGLLQTPDVVHSREGRRVVFLDEFAWFSTKRSSFLIAFANFWNTWAAWEDDLVVIICVSSTSWIAKHIFENIGSMYNRVTRRMPLSPFTLLEMRELADAMALGWDRTTLLLAHMVFGGIPAYLDLLDRDLSLDENIDALCLDACAPLQQEASRLMEATLGDTPLHRKILGLLASKRTGAHRTEVDERLGTGGSGSLKRALDDLEGCRYVRR